MSTAKCLIGAALLWFLGYPAAGQTNGTWECQLPPASVNTEEDFTILVEPRRIDFSEPKDNEPYAPFKFTLMTDAVQLDPAKTWRVGMRDKSAMFERYRPGNGIMKVLVRALKEHRPYYLVACYDGSSNPIMVSHEFTFKLQKVARDQSNSPIAMNEAAVAKVTTSRGTATGFVIDREGRLWAPAHLFAGTSIKEAQVFLRDEARSVRYFPVDDCSRPIKGHLCLLEPSSALDKTGIKPAPLTISRQQPSADESLTLLTFKKNLPIPPHDAFNQSRCNLENVGAPAVGRSGAVAIYICKNGKAELLPIVSNSFQQSSGIAQQSQASSRAKSRNSLSRQR